MSRVKKIRWVSPEEVKSYRPLYGRKPLHAELERVIVFTGGFSFLSQRVFPTMSRAAATSKLISTVSGQKGYPLGIDAFSFFAARGGAYGIHSFYDALMRECGYQKVNYIGPYKKRPFLFNRTVVPINFGLKIPTNLPKAQQRKTTKGKGITKSAQGSAFFRSTAWRKVRYETIKRYGRKCMACGQTDGQIHVDHIIPRSKRPDLALDKSNLQVLCKDCNFGKREWDQTDWRNQGGELKSVN